MKPNIKRLKKLANHLLKPLPKDRKFEFGEWTMVETDEDNNICKTCACAWGECAVLSPKYVVILPVTSENFVDRNRRRVLLKKDSTGFVTDDAAKFFHITEAAANFLFLPSEQYQRTDYFVPDLDSTSSASEVAENILWFIKHYDEYTFESI